MLLLALCCNVLLNATVRLSSECCGVAVQQQQLVHRLAQRSTRPGLRTQDSDVQGLDGMHVNLHTFVLHFVSKSLKFYCGP
jgi:hypothetical protein